MHHADAAKVMAKPGGELHKCLAPNAVVVLRRTSRVVVGKDIGGGGVEQLIEVSVDLREIPLPSKLAEPRFAVDPEGIGIGARRESRLDLTRFNRHLIRLKLKRRESHEESQLHGRI